MCEARVHNECSLSVVGKKPTTCCRWDIQVSACYLAASESTGGVPVPTVTADSCWQNFPAIKEGGGIIQT